MTDAERDLEKRLCRCCNTMLPLDSFWSGTSQCKTCCRIKRTAYYANKPELRLSIKRESDKRRNERIRAYNKERWAVKLADRPQKPLCSDCGLLCTLWDCGQWNCVPCTKKRVAARERAYDRRRRVAARARSLERRFGKPIAEAFLSYVNGSGAHSTKVSLLHLKRLCLPLDFQTLGAQAVERIDTFNTLLKKPVGNIGWECQKCGLHSFEYRFFDLDHIKPRSKGGASVSRKNLQILCPNCHRQKTCRDLYPNHFIDRQAGLITPDAVRPLPVPETMAVTGPVTNTLPRVQHQTYAPDRPECP